MIDLLSVYSKKNHCLIHKWAVLNYPLKQINEIRGFVKFSINLVNEGEK